MVSFTFFNSNRIPVINPASIIFLFLFIASGGSTFGQIVNGSFEQGPSSGWIQYSKGGDGLIGTESFFSSTSITPTVSPRTGQWMARIGGFGYNENYIGQNVTLPNTKPLYLVLHYQDRASTTSECGGLYVGATISVIVAGQTLLSSNLCYYNTVNQWTMGYFDISAAAGQTIGIVFKAEAANSVWSYLYLDDISISSVVPVKDETPAVKSFELEQNFPNPFNPGTSINYQIPRSGHVTLKVYDIMGKEVAAIIDGYMEAGKHTAEFNASNLSSGIYYYKLQSGDMTKINKMLLLK